MSSVVTKSTAPTTPKELKRGVDMFLYYTKWVNQFSDKIRVLNFVGTFPLNQDQVNKFQSLKQEFAGAAMQEIDENILFTVETDASDFAISATLNQDQRLVQLSIQELFMRVSKITHRLKRKAKP